MFNVPWDFVVDQIKTNQILVGGVGTVLVSSFLYLIKGVPTWLYYTIKRVSTIEITLTSESHLYQEIMSVLSEHRVKLLARKYSTSSGTDVVSGFGEHIALYKRRLIIFNRSLIRENLNLYEEMHVTIFTRNVCVLKSLIQDACQRPEDFDKIKIAYCSGGHWETKKRKKRKIETVFVNGNVKETIISKIDWFLKNEQWYLDRGIPYKLVFLFHGIPGTGKTSLIYGLGSHFNKTVCYINTLNNFDRMLRWMPEDGFAVAEDIDLLSASHNRDEDDDDDRIAPVIQEPLSKMSEKQILHNLLNTLDGSGTPHGLIMFITTNHIEKLDRALVRPGRIDYIYELGVLDGQRTEEMFKAFYGVDLNCDDSQYRHRTAAELQTIFMSHANPGNALTAMIEV